jgi:hypothetical protein
MGFVKGWEVKKAQKKSATDETRINTDKCKNKEMAY